jgi:hypothetical protein
VKLGPVRERGLDVDHRQSEGVCHHGRGADVGLVLSRAARPTPSTAVTNMMPGWACIRSHSRTAPTMTVDLREPVRRA